MDETAWVELRTLAQKEMIPAIHYNLLASILRRLDKIEAATAYARPQWEMTGTDATAPASSDSSPSTTGPSEKPLPSPGASPASKLSLSTGADTSESFRLAQSGMAGESLEAAAVRYLQETNESWKCYYSLALERMSELPTRTGGGTPG